MHDSNWLKINTYIDTVKFNHNHKYLVLKFVIEDITVTTSTVSL